MFDQIIKTIDENGRGGHAYGKAVRLADEAIIDDPERAIGYHMLIVAAEQYIESTGRLPVTVVQTNNFYVFFTKHAKSLQSAFDAGDQLQILNALNDLAIATRAEFDPSADPSVV